MPLITLTATITLLEPDGTALVGAEVRYRVGSPLAADPDQDLVDEAVMDGATYSVRTNSSGVASWTFPVTTVMYLTIPRAGIWDHRLSSPATQGGTWELADSLSLPAV